MAKHTKLAQVQQLGWKITPIPYFWKEGALWTNSRTGERNPAFSDFRHPAGWLVMPPEDHVLSSKQFKGRVQAIRWAWEQAAAPQPEPALGSVQSLAALASAAAASGKVGEGGDEAGLVPMRPDAELIALCREAMACDRAVDAAREDRVDPWKELEANRRRMDRLHEACREKDRLAPLIFAENVTTPEGLCAMAEVLGTLYENSRGMRAAAVCTLVRGLLKVLGEQRAEERA